jgi:Icc-related predicted phosphoesterase
LARAEEHSVDAVIIAGDICPKAGADRMTWQGFLERQKNYILQELIPSLDRFKKRNPDTKIFLDLGNDDLKVNRYILEENASLNLLHMRKHALTDEVDIIGYMNVPLTPFGIKDWEKPDTKDFPSPVNNFRTNGVVSEPYLMETWIDLHSDNTIESDLEVLSGCIDKPFIFACHAPPYMGKLDVLWSGDHAGSRAIARFIEKWAEDGRLLLSFHGHIHESPAIERVLNTPVVNIGQDYLSLQHLEFELKGLEVKIASIRYL